MKIYILFSMFFVGTIMNVQAQNKIDTTKKIYVLQLPEFYKEKGVVFSKDYIVGIDMKQLISRYTPTIDDITKAEQILSKKYNEVQKTNVDTKSFFCHWVRQYVGLVDSTGKKNIILQLVDNTKPRKLNRKLGKHWETDFVIYFADPYPGLSILFRIDIDAGYMTTEL